MPCIVYGPAPLLMDQLKFTGVPAHFSVESCRSSNKITLPLASVCRLKITHESSEQLNFPSIAIPPKIRD